ncbi:MAG: hypothetical protein HYZ38_10185 [Mycobacterium sp.]|nr:hypothetical protein [Mycobacterium sp.]
MSVQPGKWTAVFGFAVLTAAGLAVAAPAAADCVSSAGTTLCSQGSARGADTGQGPGTLNTGPYYPYPCEYDWTCGGNGFGFGIGW